MRSSYIVAALSFSVVSVTGKALGQTSLFADNYALSAPNPDTTNVNFQDATRQTGSVAPLTYLVGGEPEFSQVGNPGAPNALLLAGRSAGTSGEVSLNYNFSASPGLGNAFVIQFDVNPVQQGAGFNTTQDAWLAIDFGSTAAGRNLFPQFTDGIGLLFRGNRQTQAFDDGTDVGEGQFASTADTSYHHIEIEISNSSSGNPFGENGTPALIQAYSDYSSTPFFSYIRPTGFSSNYLSFVAEGDGSGGDGVVRSEMTNLSLSLQPIAEPMFTWNNAVGTGDGKTWDIGNNQNWNVGQPTTYSQYDNVTFNDTNNSNYNVILNSSVTPSSVVFANSKGNYILSGSGGIGGAASLSFTGSGTVTMSTSNTYTGPTNVVSGTAIIAAASALPTGAAVTIGGSPTPAVLQLAAGIGPTTISSLNLNPNGTLDITNNQLMVNFNGSDPVGTIRGNLQSAFAGGSWTGTGLTSSTVESQAASAKGTNKAVYSLAYIDGNTDGSVAAANGVGPNQILIEPELAADANLDGQVNFSDLVTLAQNFGSTTADWVHGDFNFDSICNFQDLVLLAQNFGATNGTTLLDSELPASFDAQWQLAQAEVRAAGGSSSVPEPGSVGLLAIAAGRLVARRRRRR